MKPAAVIIGRNEGARFLACLASLGDQFAHVVYVDSGSTDGSIAAAEAAGLDVLHLDTSRPFTAARARNAGLARLRERGENFRFVQFLDGDCTICTGWIPAAMAQMAAHPRAAMVCGRRREKHPEASVYNRLIDGEWDTPIGPALASGGDVLARMEALEEVGGFNPDLIAGEEPELCLRLRRKDWEIWRIDAEMTGHDAALTRFSQWWQRAKRAGYTYAEGAAMYGRAPERLNLRALKSALAWGLALPLALLLGAVVLTPWLLSGFALYPAQVGRLKIKSMGWAEAFFLTLGKFPEAQGAVMYAWRRITRARAQLIEYK